MILACRFLQENIWILPIFLRILKILGDIRLWVGPRIEHLLSAWDLTRNLKAAVEFHIEALINYTLSARQSTTQNDIY